MAEEEYRGHMTMADGSHVPLTADEAKSIFAAAEGAREKQAEDMPTTAHALRVMHTARDRLRRLGWKEGMYCPKDGTPFALIQYGSTGIFKGWYTGEWPEGRIYCCDYLDHPSGVLFKPIDDLTDEERAKMEECMGHEKAAHVTPPRPPRRYEAGVGR